MPDTDSVVVVLVGGNIAWILAGVFLIMVGTVTTSDGLTGVFDFRSLGDAWKTAGVFLGAADIVMLANWLGDNF